jgi:hypothetical protein
MHQPNPDEALAAEIEQLCIKYGLDSGMVAVSKSTHFLIITCNMSPKVMRVLGHTLLENTVPTNTTVN